MIEPDTTGWREVGKTSNSRCFALEDGVLAAVPDRGAVDTLKTARENREFQHEYFRQAGQAGVVLVFMDLMREMDKGARRVYTEMDPRYVRGTALVGGSLLGRAIASFFLGVIARPQIKVKMFASTEDALLWARELNRAGANAGPR